MEGQGGCGQRIEVFVKIKKKLGGGGASGQGFGLGVQGGCKRRIEVFVKILKKRGGGGSGCGVVRVELNKELKFL